MIQKSFFQKANRIIEDSTKTDEIRKGAALAVFLNFLSPIFLFFVFVLLKQCYSFFKNVGYDWAWKTEKYLDIFPRLLFCFGISEWLFLVPPTVFFIVKRKPKMLSGLLLVGVAVSLINAAFLGLLCLIPPLKF